MLPRHELFRWAYPFIIGSIAVEIFWYLKLRKRPYPWREMFTSVVIYALRVPMRLLRPLIVAPLIFLAWSHRVATVPLDTVWGLALLFLGVELAYYWMHRASHEVRWMWASHVVHHSPQSIHFASAFRLGATEILSGNWLFYFPLYLLGLHPAAVAGMLAINLFYQFWLHTDLVGKLGPLEWVLNTPSHHRVHHASNGEYLDRNYGGIVIIWDRFFGSFVAEQQNIPITYGLVHPIGSLNPLKVLFSEWRLMAVDFWRARSWRERVRQLFGRPVDSLAHSRRGDSALRTVSLR